MSLWDYAVAGFYIALGAFGVRCAWRSRSVGLMSGAVGMLVSCLITNASIFGLGFDTSRDIIPEADAAIGVMLLWVGISLDNRTLIAVFGLFLLEMVIYVIFITLYHLGFWSDLLLNMVYSSQVILIVWRARDEQGGVGGPSRRSGRLDHPGWGHPSSLARVASRKAPRLDR